MTDSEPPFDDPVILPIEDHLDLHPFQPKEIASVVEEYLEQCKEAGFHEVRLIHGKGKGVQRNIIRALLAKHAGVASFHDAAARGRQLGGDGGNSKKLSARIYLSAFAGPAKGSPPLCLYRQKSARATPMVMKLSATLNAGQ